MCTYPFTAPALAVHLNDAVLHVLTDRGLETYTLRTGHRLFGSAYEYLRPAPPPLRQPPAPAQPGRVCGRRRDTLTGGGHQRSDQEASPSADDPVSLIGLRPFMNVCTMHGADRALVLLAAAPRQRQRPGGRAHREPGATPDGGGTFGTRAMGCGMNALGCRPGIRIERRKR